MRRLSIEISPEQHQQIKTMAALQGMSIKDLVLKRLFSNSDEEDRDWDEFMSFLKGRIDHAVTSPASTKTLDDIAQDIIRRKSVS